MIDKQFLGINITDDDDYGVIHLKLALDLLNSIREQASDEVVEEKARNIVQVCCEPMLDSLIVEHDWNWDEAEYAEQLLVQCMGPAIISLIELAKRRIKHIRRHERCTKLQIDDLKIAAIMAYVMTVPDNVGDRLEETFLENHGAMYFSR